jgi:hypothetical protein
MPTIGGMGVLHAEFSGHRSLQHLQFIAAGEVHLVELID